MKPLHKRFKWMIHAASHTVLYMRASLARNLPPSLQGLIQSRKTMYFHLWNSTRPTSEDFSLELQIAPTTLPYMPLIMVINEDRKRETTGSICHHGSREQNRINWIRFDLTLVSLPTPPGNAIRIVTISQRNQKIIFFLPRSSFMTAL